MERCEELAVIGIKKTSPQCLASARVMDMDTSPSYGDYMCPYPRSSVLASACTLAEYKPKMRPVRTQAGSEEPGTTSGELDPDVTFTFKRSSLIGAAIGNVIGLAGYVYTARRHNRKNAETIAAQSGALKIAACTENPILCTTHDDIVTELRESTNRTDGVKLEAEDIRLASFLHDVVDRHAGSLREQDGSLSVKSLHRNEDLETTMLREIRSVATNHGDPIRAEAVAAAVNRVLANNRQRALRDRRAPG